MSDLRTLHQKLSSHLRRPVGGPDEPGVGGVG